MTKLLERWQVRDWIFAVIGAVVVWAAMIAYAGGQGAWDTVVAGLAFASFYVLVAIGQMFVIASGPGNIDLSIPSTVTLGGVIAMRLMDGQVLLILPGILAALAAGALVGLFNYGLIRLLRIPPIIATLSSNLVILSVAIVSGRGLTIKPPADFASFIVARFLGIPMSAWVALVITLLGSLVLRRTVFGRTVLAIGQNANAAHLAGLSVERTRLVIYLASAMLATLAGTLFAGFAGGAALDMGYQFLLPSIATVVIGGTAVAGGRANFPGLWAAALFMFFVVSMLNTMGASTGLRQMVTGLLIILVIAAAGRGATTR